MNKLNNNIKFYTFINVMSQYSDENVSLSTSDINSLMKKEINKFTKEEIDITLDRRTIYGYIEDMKNMGFDISRYSKEDKGYKLLGHRLEEYEVKIITDAIAASRFVTKNKTKELINKISKFRAEYTKKEIYRNIFIDNRSKSKNEEIFINIDKINNAIKNKKKISFNYSEYNYKKELVARVNSNNENRRYIASPISIILKNENYYLILLDNKHDDLSNYRIDRMKSIEVLDEEVRDIKKIKEYKNGFNPVLYSKKSFKMFPGAESEIYIKFNENLLNFMIDSFGEDIDIKKGEEGKYIGKFTAKVGKGLVRWILQLGHDGEVIYPNELKDLIKKEIVSISDIYK